MKNILQNLVVCLSIAFILSGCTVEWRDRGHTPTTPVVYTELDPNVSYIEIEFYYDDACWDIPYWHSEEWCDYYDDGSSCCVWYVDGWYEEWCQWEDDYCWEYNGSF